MLQSIHDKLKGWVAYVVLGAVASTFVLWGINWTLGTADYAAKVNGRDIPVNEVREAYQRQLAQLVRGEGGQVDEVQRAALKQKVLDEFIGSEALISRAEELGYRVSDAELLKEMARIPAFQVAGKFDQAHAVAVLKAQGRSIPEIEAMIRHNVQLQQLDTALRYSSFATPGEIKKIAALMDQQRELAWLVLPAAHFAATATPDDTAINAWYAAHKADYMTPELVNLRYVEISLAQLSASITVSEAQLRAYFDEQKTKNPDAYTQAEQRRVRHILFQVSDPKDDAAVKAKAEQILKRAQGGEDFAKLAQEFSQDPGSAKQGGDLGMSERKVWVAPFADAAFQMNVGDIRGPVKTQFGYHILKLDAIQPASTRTFEQGRADIEAEYRRSEADRLFNSLQDRVADAALQNSTDIEVVARKAGLPVQQINDFSREGGGGALAKAPKVIEAAFSQDVLDGHLSQIVEVEKGRGVILRATDHRLPQQKPLGDVRADVVAAWKKQQGVELAQAAAADAIKRLQGGESWERLAKSLGGTLQAPHFVSRNDQAVPIALRRAAFEAPKPATGKPVYRALALDSGDGAVYGVSAVREGADDNPEKKGMMAAQYALQIGSGEALSYADGARAEAKVIVNPRSMD
ncbi:MAG: SurA N-terminal domain-containing protein [Steroidobacterales bacterium]